MDYYVIADQIVSFSRINDSEIFSINRKFAVYAYLFRIDIDLCWKGYCFLYPMQLKIAGDYVVSRSLIRIGNDLCGFECGLRILVHFKKISGLEMLGHSIGVRENRVHFDIY